MLYRHFLVDIMEVPLPYVPCPYLMAWRARASARRQRIASPERPVRVSAGKFSFLPVQLGSTLHLRYRIGFSAHRWSSDEYIDPAALHHARADTTRRGPSHRALEPHRIAIELQMGHPSTSPHSVGAHQTQWGFFTWMAL